MGKPANRHALTDTLYNLRGAVLLITFATSVLVYSFRTTSFNHPKEFALTLGLCVLAVLGAGRGSEPSSLRGFMAFLPLWLGCMASFVFHVGFRWAHVPSDALMSLAQTATLLLIPVVTWDLFASKVWRTRFVAALYVVGAVVAFLGILQYLGAFPFLFTEFQGYSQRIYSVFGNQDLLGGFMALALPAALHHLAEKRSLRFLALVSVPLLLAALLLSGSRSAWLAAAVGTAVVWMQVRPPFPAVRAIALAGFCVITTVSLLAPEATVGRVLHTFTQEDVGGRARLWFWDGSLRMVAAHPWAGVGPGNFAYWSPRFMGEALTAPGGQRHFNNELLVEHPHSEPLLILAELGLAGGLLAGWMLLRVTRCRGIEWAPLSTLLVFAWFNAPFQCPAHALAGVALAAALLAQAENGHEQCGAKSSRWLSWFAVPCAMMLTLFHGYAVLMPSTQLRAAEDAHLAGEDAIPLYEKAVAGLWPNAEAHLRLGLAFAEANRYEEAEKEVREALKGLDTGEAYLILGATALRLGKVQEAKTWLSGCLERWPHNANAKRLLDAIETNALFPLTPSP